MIKFVANFVWQFTKLFVFLGFMSMFMKCSDYLAANPI